MKWLPLLLAGVLVLALNACQQHSVTELQIIKMSNEQIPQASQPAKAGESPTPAQESKPAPDHLQ